jgi:hypothetical protein
MKQQKGISQIAVMIIMLILAIALPITTNLVKKSQENRSKAADVVSQCSALNASNKDACVAYVGCSWNDLAFYAKDLCTGTYTQSGAGGYATSTGESSGCTANAVRCIKPSSTSIKGVKQQCTGGLWKDIEDCPNGCYGDGCYVETGGANGGNGSSSIKQDSKCTDAKGTCKLVSGGCSGGSFLTGYCPSSDSTIKCCVSGSSSSTGGGSTSSGSGNPGRCVTYSAPTAKDLTTTKTIGDLCGAFYTSSGHAWPDVTLSNGVYSWICYGSAGSNANCSATAGSGSTSGGNPGRCIAYSSPTTKDLTTTKNISDLCDAFYTSSGHAWPDVAKNGNTYTWICYGSAGSNVNCSAEIAVPSCTDANWTASALSPVVCPSSSQQTKTWTQTGTCSGGVAHPATEAVACTYVPDSSSVTLKMAFAGVKPESDQCAVNWPVIIRVVDKDGNTALINNFSGVPTKTSEVNGKGEIVYSFTGTLTGVPNAGVSGMSAFLTGPKHLSIKYGVDKQTSWYKTLAGQLTVKTGTNNYDFSGYSLLAGDVTGDTAGVPDGKIDGRDFSYIKERADATSVVEGPAGTNVAGDIDGNCQVNSGDVRLVKQSMIEINGQTY